MNWKWRGTSVSVGFGTGFYDDWSYNSYAAAPDYGCTCAGRNYSYAPRSRSYATVGYAEPNYYSGYGSYNDRYYDNYASVGFGWSDGGWANDGWRDRRSWRGDNRSWRDDNRRVSVDRGIRTSARVSFDGEFRGGTRGRSRVTAGAASDNMRIGQSDNTRIGASVRTNGNGRSGVAVRARGNVESGR
jgi:hypothetical protein